MNTEVVRYEGEKGLLEKNLKAILFDFDGVLGDTMEDNYLAWKRTCEDYGATLTREEYFPFEGMPLKKIAQTIIEKNGLKEISLESIVAKKEAYYKKDHHFSFYKGVPEFIDTLKRNGIKIAVVSAALRPRLFSSVPPDFLSRFDAIITGESVERGKPYPDPYLAAMKELAVSADECIIVENAPLGITSAKAAKAYCIAIASTMDKSYLSEADQIIEKFSDLSSINKILQAIKEEQ